MIRTQVLPLVAFFAMAAPVVLPEATASPSPAEAERASTSASSSRVTETPEAPEPPVPPEPRGGVDGRDTQLESLYRELFEIHARIGRAESAAEADSLRSLEKDILLEIQAQLKRDAGETRTKVLRGLHVEEVPQEEVDAFLEELEQLDVDVDWEELGEILESSLDEIGQGLGELGEFLQEIEVNSGEIDYADPRSGDRVHVVLPPEVRRNVTEGLRALQGQLREALQDTAGYDLRRELESLQRYLPEGAVDEIARRARGFRPPKRKIIAKSVFRLSEDFELAADEAIQGDVLVIGADCYIAGEVQGSAFCVLGDIFVEDSGTVGKDAISLGGEVSLDGDSSVRGRMFDIGDVAPGFFSAYSGRSGSFALVMHGVRVAVLALLLFLFAALAGDRLQEMADHTVANSLRDLLAGSLWLSIFVGGFVVSAVGLAITIIGIPVVVVLSLAFFGLLLTAYFVTCQVLGARLLSMVGSDRSHSMWFAGLLGLAVLEIPAFLAASTYPWVGPSSMFLQGLDYVFKFMALAIGFGAIVATRLGSRARRAAASTADPVGSPPVQTPSI